MDVTVSLPEELSRFIEDQIAAGRYASSRDLIHDALRLLERRDRDQTDKRRWLQDAWRDGVSSGDAGEIDFDDLKQDARTRLASQS